jgi:hypothetical protein
MGNRMYRRFWDWLVGWPYGLRGVYELGEETAYDKLRYWLFMRLPLPRAEMKGETR